MIAMTYGRALFDAAVELDKIDEIKEETDEEIQEESQKEVEEKPKKKTDKQVSLFNF